MLGRFGKPKHLLHRCAKTTFYGPHKYKRVSKCHRVFVCPLSDFFHKDADKWRNDAWDVMLANPDLTFLILTKRPENIEGRLPLDVWPLKNVWMGVSVESRDYLGRIRALVENASGVLHFVSYEPLLGPIVDGDYDDVEWVIVGGETGPAPRIFREEWGETIRLECQDRGIPFWFKQHNGPGPNAASDVLCGQKYHELPEVA